MISGTLYYVGCDLGKAQDYSTLCILERSVRIDPDSAWSGTSLGRDEPQAWYGCRHLERFELGTPYPMISERLRILFENPEIKQLGKLIIDETGVGGVVVDFLRKEGLKPIGITITDGNEVSERPGGFNVPKKEIVSSLLLLFQCGSFKVAESLPLADAFEAELQNFRVKLSARTGAETYEAWKENDKDDLVMCVAIAAWYASRRDSLMKDFGKEPWKEDEQRNLYDPIERV
jgi:hypothetical protein